MLAEAVQHAVAAIQKWCGAGGCLLEVGCGTSGLAECVYRYTPCRPILATDASEEAIKRCTARRTLTAELKYAQMNCCNLPLPAASWDIVLDKGMLDALDCANNSRQAESEIARVLKPQGLFVLVSCRDPLQRLATLSQHFHLEELQEVRSSPNKSTPCPDAYIYCLRRLASVQ